MNEYEEYEEQFTRSEIENAIQGEFVIDNDSKAEWALKKIKEAQDEHDNQLVVRNAQNLHNMNMQSLE